MAKSTSTYLQIPYDKGDPRWQEVEGSRGTLDQWTLAEDPTTGDVTRLTLFLAGSNTEAYGPKAHDYPEEIFILEGRLYDAAFHQWLEKGTYASRPPGETHGPFTCGDQDCIVLEVSTLSQST